MNISKAHEYLEITDTYLGKEVTGGCTFINSENLSVTLTIKDVDNKDRHVNGYISKGLDSINLSVGCDYSFDPSIGKYVIDIIQGILNEVEQ